MSVVVVIDPLLRETVAQALRAMARDHHRSIARLIKPEFFEIVTDAIAEDVDVTWADLDVALVASASRIRERMPHAFMRPPTNPKTANKF